MFRLLRLVTIVLTCHVIFCASIISAQPTVWDGEFSTLWFDAVNWDNNVVPGMTDDVMVDAPSPTDVDGNVTINSLNIGQNGVLNLQPGVCMEFGDVPNPLVNAGNINLGAAAKLILNNDNNSSGIIDLEENAEILVNGPVCLGGGGNIFLGGGLFGGIGGMPQPNFLQLGMEVAGFGQVGDGNIEQIGIGEDGKVKANMPNQAMVIAPGNGGCIVAGDLSAEKQGIIDLFNGIFDLSGGGKVIVEPGAKAVLRDGVEILGGQVGADGKGGGGGDEACVKVDDNANVKLLDVDLIGPALIEVANNALAEFEGAYNSTATISVTNATAVFSGSKNGGKILANDGQNTKVIFKDKFFWTDGEWFTRTINNNPEQACLNEFAHIVVKDGCFGPLDPTLQSQVIFLINNGATLEICSLLENAVNIVAKPNGNNTKVMVNGTLLNKNKVTASPDPSGNGMAVIQGDGGGDDQYVNEEGATTEGCGEIRDMEVTNCGMVEANEQGEMLAVKDSTVTNQGSMRATGGGILGFLGTDTCNEGGTIEAGTGSMVKDMGKNDSKGGKYITPDDALPGEPGTILIDTGLAGSRYTDTEFDGNISVANGSTVTLAGEIINRQGFNIQPGNLNTDIELDGAVNFSGGGTLRLGEGTRLTSGDSLILENQTISGSGSLGSTLSLLDIQASSLIEANENGEVLSVAVGNGGSVTNQNALQASGGGILELRGSSGVYENAGGVIQALAGSTIRFDGPSSRIVGGLLRTEDDGAIVVTPGSGPKFVNLTIDADIDTPNGAPISVEGAINNLGSLSVLSDIDVDPNGATISGGGEIKLDGPSARIDGGNLHSLEINGQTRLSGDGSVVNAATVFNGAQIAPGQSIGTLNFFVGNQEQKIVGGTVLDIEIGNATGTPGIDWDFISISGGGGASLNLADDNMPSGVVIKVTSLDQNGDPGLLPGFDPNTEFTFPIVSATGSILNFDPTNFEIDASAFANKFDGQFAVTVSGNNDQELLLKYLPYLLGDINSDGVLNLLDVQPFVQQLQGKGKINPAADMNCDGEVNLLDVQPFVDALAG